MQRSWLGWHIGMESKGLKVNIGKTEVMVSSRRGTKVNIKDSQGTSLRQVNTFKYLGVTISEERGSEEAVRARVSAAWDKWRDISGVISDKKMPRKLKIKLYMTVIRPVLLYGEESWTVRKKEEQILEKTEMRMLRRIKGVTLRDRVKSVDIRKELGVILFLLLLQAFIKRHISGTSPLIGAYTHYNKMYIESYKRYLKMYSMVCIHVHS